MPDLSDGWEANESNRRYPGSRNIEAHGSTSTTAARWCGDELASKFRELRLELPQMIARGFILLGFGPSNIRTRHESLEEEDTLLAFENVRAPEDYRSSEAYHLIFDFLSEDISILHREGGEESCFYFLYGGHDCGEIFVFLQKEILVSGCLLATAAPLAFFTSSYHTFQSRINCRSLILTVFHATGRSCRSSNSPDSTQVPFLICTLKSPNCHHVWRSLMEARNCPGS